MKKYLLVLTIMSFMLFGCACGKQAQDLKGSWKQVNSNSDDAYQIAAIDDDSISVYWYTEEDDMSALYWAGTFKVPTSGGKKTVESSNYHDLTDYALLATEDDTKTFTFENNKMSFVVSVAGVENTIVMEKDDSLNVEVKKGSASQSSGSEGSNTNASGQTADEVADQVKVKANVTKDGQVVVLATNNSETVIDDLELELNFLNSSGSVIASEEDGHDMVLPGSTVVSVMDAPSSGFDDVESNYHVSLDVYPGYENHSEDVSVESNPGDNGVIVRITNNGDVSIDEIEYLVLAYKGNDIVTASHPNDILNLAPGSTETEEVSFYNDKTYEFYVYGKDYDSIKVYLNQAHTFGF